MHILWFAIKAPSIAVIAQIIVFCHISFLRLTLITPSISVWKRTALGIL